MELIGYLRIVQNRWRTLAVCAALGLAVAAILCLVLPARYTAVSKSFVSAGRAANVTDLSQAGVFAQQAVTGYAQVAQTPYVLAEVIKRLHLAMTPEQLTRSLSVTTDPGTAVLEISVEQDSPVRAARIANAIAAQLSTAALHLTPVTSSATLELTQIQVAAVPRVPSAPVIPLMLSLGLLVGLVAGFLISTLNQLLDTRLRSPSAAVSAADTVVVGELPFDSTLSKNGPLIVSPGARGAHVEAYRTFRANLNLLLQTSPGSKLVVITSSVPNEGKTVSALNLAVVMSMAGRKTVLLDADLRRPGLSDFFHLRGRPGLSDLLTGRASLSDVLVEGDESMPARVGAGTVVGNPAELLQSTDLGSVFSDLKGRFDLVIVDTPPLLPVSDALLIASLADLTLLIGAMKKVKENQLRSAVDKLARANAQLAGLVLTMVPPSEISYDTEYS